MGLRFSLLKKKLSTLPFVIWNGHLFLQNDFFDE